MKKTSFGSWKSPITTDSIISKSKGLFDIKIFGNNIFWTESRPDEGGRSTIVKKTSNGNLETLAPTPFNTRSRVHEYGGLAYEADENYLYFCNYSDQHIYKVSQNEKPVQVTPQGNFRYADMIKDSKRNRLICVREEHGENLKEPINTIVSLNLLDPNDVKIVAQGADFYSFPRISPDGKFLSYICWNHPNMPWDASEVWIAELTEDGSTQNLQKIAGDDCESIFQPEWCPNGDLYFISDKNGWWNFYKYQLGKINEVLKMDAEFGLPLWVFGMSTYGFESEENIICTFCKDGIWQLGKIHLPTGELQIIKSEFTTIDYLKAAPGKTVFRGSSQTKPISIVELDLATGQHHILATASQVNIDNDYISIPETIEYPNKQGQKVLAFFYPPKNQDYIPQNGEKPPLIVIGHGGPTGSTSNAFNLKTQFWTSRGFAVLDVNYSGSTGLGREYKDRLNGTWGILDVQDCVDGANYLSDKGLADPEKLIIRGSSAGGYTTLAALTFHDVFKAGASYYGISDLEALAGDTHKFESRYTDRLVGKYPENQKTYQERSPINYTEKLHCPVIFFQGLEDKVVPPNQAEMLVDALRKKGIPVAYITFENEAHGFRKAETIKAALDAELYFYSQIFGFDPPAGVPPITIENLQKAEN